MEKLLYVDDEEINLRLFEINFGKSFKVITLLNPVEAIHKIEIENIKVLVTDYKMPVLNGMQLIEKAKGIYSDLTCIILSAYMESDVVTDKSKVFKYIMKPFKKEELFELLKEAFRKSD